MSYWEILGVAKTCDLKAIKRAYATKLKVTKPDEDPEGFKCLHAAYKQACQYARSNASVDKEAIALPVEISAHNETQLSEEWTASYEEPQSEEDFQFVLDPPDESPIDYSSQYSSEDNAFQKELEAIASADPDEEYALLQQKWQEITTRVDEVTANDKTMNDIEAWAFLNDRDAFPETVLNKDVFEYLQFKSELSNYIFGRLNDRLSEMQPKPVLNKDVFQYLDSQFFWSNRSDLLEDEFGHEAVDNVMQALLAVSEQKIQWTSPKVHKGEMIACNYFARLFATFLDWLLLGFIAVVLSKMGLPILSTNSDERIFGFIAGVYIALASLMEASPLQGTPGKILFGMKVISKNGRRLNILHALLRSFMFILVLEAFMITVWIMMFIKDHRLLHDRFSYSMVIKR